MIFLLEGKTNKEFSMKVISKGRKWLKAKDIKTGYTNSVLLNDISMVY